LLPLLLVIYFSLLYIFRAIGRTVFIVNQLGHALAHRCMKSDMYMYIYMCIAEGAAFSTMFDHLSI
jgi:hypothetical protein